MRSVDVVARYGGDEFPILMPSTSAEHSRTAIARLELNLARWQPGLPPKCHACAS